MGIAKKLFAEFFGTFWLVFGGTGSAILAGGDIGYIGVAFAFGLTVLTMVYTVGPISGGHFNPAVSFGLWAGGRFPGKDLLPYIVAQVVGAIVASGALYLIASGNVDFNVKDGFAANGYGDHSPGGYSMMSAVIVETILTFMFIFIIMGATDKLAPIGFAGLAIGMALVLIHLISIPITNTSVNPARSTGPALFVGGWALTQLWLFWIAPLVGGILGGVTYKTLFGKKD